jgi:hypothetical protein
MPQLIATRVLISPLIHKEFPVGHSLSSLVAICCREPESPKVTKTQQVLATQGWHINTAFIKRLNLTIRQHVAAVGRRVMTLCKGEAGLRQQLAVYQVYYNFCLPHASLRLPLPQPEPTNGTGSAKRWRPQTPAMAAGLTDHIWKLREVLLFRVPSWRQLQAL